MFSFFFFNDTATTEIYTLSLLDALPIYARPTQKPPPTVRAPLAAAGGQVARRSEEHTSELQSRLHLVCRLLLEKKKETEQENFISEGLVVGYDDVSGGVDRLHVEVFLGS